jgi:Amt family ammonium transporter
MAMAIISLVWVVVGFSLAFGDSFGGVLGDPRTFLFFRGVGGDTHVDLAPTIPLLLFALFQLKFAIITPALITGAFAERVRFGAYVLFLVLFSLFIYAPLAHWTWHPDGFLRKWGVLDFAGGTVVHMSAGFAALAGAMVLGRRKLPEGAHTPANLPFVLLGTGMLWFGWFGFNAGSALGANALATSAFATTNTASAAAMLGWMAFDYLRGKKPSAMGAAVGAVVGLVAVTPAAGFITVGQSILVGVVAAVVSNFAVALKSKTTLDDTLDVFPCHGLGGVVGMLLTGVLAKDVGLFYGQTHTFLMHLLALVIVAAFSFGGSFIDPAKAGYGKAALDILLHLGPSPVPLARLLDQIDHVARVAGIDHVGLGSDFDGTLFMPEGARDVAGFPNITAGLLARGYSEEKTRKILGENFLRVFAQAEAVAGR